MATCTTQRTVTKCTSLHNLMPPEQLRISSNRRKTDRLTGQTVDQITELVLWRQLLAAHFHSSPDIRKE